MNLSIRTRLTAWFTAVLFCGMMLLSLLLFWGLHRSINSTTDKEIKGKLAAISAMMQASIPKLPMAELEDEFREQSSLGGDLIQVRSADGDWIFRSPSTQQPSPELVSIASSAQPGLHEVVANGKVFRVLTENVSISGRTYVIQIAADVSEFAELLQKFKWLAVVLIPLIMLMAFAGGYWLSSRAFSPILEIIEKARSINAANLSSRLAVPANRDELQKLSETLNGMLDRIESSFKKIQQFSDDASHELRTPIALVRTTAELALRKEREPETYRDALTQILQESERTSGMIEDLLVLARTDTSSQLPMVRIDLAAVVRNCCSKIAPLAEAKQIALSVQIANLPAFIQGNPESLERLLLIVLDNAIKYSHSPGSIVIKLEQNGRSASVTVEDSGIGIAEEDIARIFERFYRADKARSRDSGGAGLGLSIAKWIADMHRAELTVVSNIGRGTSFDIRFPQDIGR